jgi:PhoPQ-activated pathogenicity-related protein
MKKYIPRNPRVTIWSLNEGGKLQHVEVVDKEEFKDKHAEQILAFFDQLKKQDPSFNKTKAIDSTFIIVDDEGQQSIVPADDKEPSNEDKEMKQDVIADLLPEQPKKKRKSKSLTKSE